MADGGGVRVLLLPLEGAPALVPTALVAEITSYATPVAPRDAPPWLLGFVRWRGQRLPLVSLEAALGRAPAVERVGRQRTMVVLRGLTAADELAYYAVVTAGPPHPSTAREEELQVGSRSAAPFRWGRVELAEVGLAEIPDLERLEQALAPLAAAQPAVDTARSPHRH